MILVTGAEGFLGRSVCASLAQQNIANLGVDQHSAHPFDIGDPAAVDTLFRRNRFEIVVHLAALLPSACRLNPVQGTRVNVTGSVNLLDAAIRFGTQRFVFGSSMSAAQEPLDLYGAGKRYIESYGELLARDENLAFVALRLATIVGPGARRTASPWRSEIFEKLGSAMKQRIEVPLSGGTKLSLVYVDDAARMLITLATAPRLPASVYDSPGENWRMADLKQFVEGLGASVSVHLAESGARPLVPLADGAPWIRDFGWQAAPLTERLSTCLLK